MGHFGWTFRREQYRFRTCVMDSFHLECMDHTRMIWMSMDQAKDSSAARLYSVSRIIGKQHLTLFSLLVLKVPPVSRHLERARRRSCMTTSSKCPMMYAGICFGLGDSQTAYRASRSTIGPLGVVVGFCLIPCLGQFATTWRSYIYICSRYRQV